MYKLGRQTYFEKHASPVGNTLDWVNPITKSLVFYVNGTNNPNNQGSAAFQIYEHVSRTSRFPQSATLVTSVPGHTGNALNFTGASGSEVTWPVNTNPPTLPFMLPFKGTDTVFTMGCKLRYTSATLDSSPGGFNSSGTCQWDMLTGHSAVGAGALGINTADTSFTFTAGAGYNDGQWYTVFIWHIPGNTQGVAIYDKDGKFIESVSGSTTAITGGTATDFSIGGASGNIVLFNGQIEWSAVWNRYLDRAEMDQMAKRPYQITKFLT